MFLDDTGHISPCDDFQTTFRHPFVLMLVLKTRQFRCLGVF